MSDRIKFSKRRGLGDYISVVKMLLKRKKYFSSGSTKNLSPLPHFNALAKSIHPKNLLTVKIASIESINYNTVKYTLVALEGEKLPYFRAGQYICVKLNIGDSYVSRPFSIAKAPNSEKYSITIKRSTFASRYIMDNWKLDQTVQISAPEGNFYYEPLRDEKHVIAIAGGSGITPFFSMAEAISKGIEDFKLTILFGVRTIDDMLYQDEFLALEKATKGKIKTVYVISESKVLGLEYGFVTKEIIEKYAPNNQPYSVFLCGPQVMTQFVEKEIAKIGLDQKHFRKELFGEVKNPSGEPDYPQGLELDSTYHLFVNVRGTRYDIMASINESLLVAMERKGIKAPSSCRSGECGFCRSRLISGEVYTPSKLNKLRQADKVYGYIHPCICYPLSDVEIEIPIGE